MHDTVYVECITKQVAHSAGGDREVLYFLPRAPSFTLLWCVCSTANCVEREIMRNCCYFVTAVTKAVTLTAINPGSPPYLTVTGFVLLAYRRYNNSCLQLQIALLIYITERHSLNLMLAFRPSQPKFYLKNNEPLQKLNVSRG